MSNKSGKFVILKQNPLTDIQTPIRSTQRIKYTCFTVSHKYLVLGATSGGIYVFKRTPCKFQHLIPTKEGSIAKISISKDERFIAFASARGTACVLEWDENEDKSRLINRSLEHNGSHITEMVWADVSNELFIGDSIGRLSVINVSLSVSKSIFLLPAFIFMQLDSGIVQLSCLDNYLLVSTETWCYICDTSKEHYKQIGSKLREGEYGACFFNNDKDVIIFCARPGSRLWEVNLNGTVISTHQLKKVLATSPTPVVCVDENKILVQSRPSWPEQPFNFCYLSNFLGRFLLTFKSDGIYVIDPIAVKVVLWTNLFSNIVSVKCISDTIYVWTSSGELHCLDALLINECLLQLYFQDNLSLCLELFEMHLDELMSCNKYFKSLSPLLGLKDFIPPDKRKLLRFFENLKLNDCDTQSSTKLDSGIFLVENRHWKKWKVAEVKSASKVKKLPYYYKTRSLPHDILGSRQRTNSYKMQHTMSLPDFHLVLEPLGANNSSFDGMLVDSNKYNLLPKIPFLSIASPEVFHSTISELHQNVSGKLFTGTRSLKRRWQSLEGKFKFLMLNSSPSSSEQGNSIEWKNPPDSEIRNMNGTNCDEIASPPINPPKAHNKKIDVSDILGILNLILKTDDPKKDVLFKLFDAILNKYNFLCAQDYKGTFSKDKSIFPFSELFPPECNEVIKMSLHTCIKNGKMFLYLENIKESLTQHFVYPDHPQLLTEIYTAYQLKLDCFLRNILYIFSELLDPFIILHNLETSKFPCIFHCWSIILDTFQESALNYITSDESNGFEYKSWPLPLLLNTIFLMFRLQQVESSYHMATESELKFYHISFLILKLSLHFESTGMMKEERENICNQLLLKYVTKLLESKCFKIDYMFDFTVAYHLESAFLKFNSPTVPICACGHSICEKQNSAPRFIEIGKLLLFLHLVNYKTPHYRILNNNFEIFIDSTSPEDVFIQTLLSTYIKDKNITPGEDLTLENLKPSYENEDEFSFNEKYKKIMKLLQALPELFVIVMKCVAKDVTEIIPFIVQYAALNDLNYLIVPMDEKFWKSLCDLNVDFSKGMCCICLTPFSENIEVDWNAIAIIMLKSLLASQTISLLKTYSMDIAPESLDIRFYRACILSSIISSSHSENHNSLIDNYYDISSSVAKEGSQASDLLLLDDTTQYTPNVVQNQFSSTWGIQVDINMDVCGRCALLLNSKNLTQDGLRAFKCGHIYHTICLHLGGSDFRCPICISIKETQP